MEFEYNLILLYHRCVNFVQILVEYSKRQMQESELITYVKNWYC